jgi:bacillithiol system protein YtxJ
MLTDEKQLAEIRQNSFNINLKAILLFKHSTRCSISDVALNRLERAWKLPVETVPAYYLDLIKFRNISSLIAQELEVEHQSPQILIIKNGKCIYTASHSEISYAAIIEKMELNTL